MLGSSQTREWWRVVFVLLLVLFPAVVQAEDQPNILILLGDDINRSSLGPWGGQALTPHLDQLANLCTK